MGPARSTRHFLEAALSQARVVLHIIADSLERKRTHQLTLVVVVSMGLGLVVAHSALSIRHLRQQWAAHEPVLVTRRLVRAGEQITAENTRQIQVPLAIVAPDALRSVAPGTHAKFTLTERTPISGSMVDLESSRISVPTGWRGVALPADLVAPTVTAGDRVDIVAAGSIAASDALVLSIGPDREITVAVPAAVAATVATAARLGEVSLILSS